MRGAGRGGVVGLVAGARRIARPERRPSAVVLGVWGVVVLWLANASLAPAGDYDYGLYHLNLIDYARKYAALPGLADLHVRLGAGDAHLLFVALLDRGPLAGVAPHFLDGLLASLVLFDLATRLAFRPASTWLRSYTSTFGLLLVPAVLVMASDRPTHRISSPNLDYAAFLLVLVGALYLAECIEGGFSLPPALVSVCAFATTAATRPLYWLWAGYALVLLVVLAGRARSWRAAAALGVLPALIGLGWLARQSVLSGYPLYPPTVGGLPVGWRLPAALLSHENRVDFAWAREPGVNPDVVFGSWHWLSIWLAVQRRNLDVTLPLALLVLGLAIALSRGFRASAPGRRKVALVLLAPSLVTLVIWFATAPDPRFAWGAIWVGSLSVLAWMLPDAVSAPRLVELVAAAAVALFVAWFGYEHRLWFLPAALAGAAVTAVVLVAVRGRPWAARFVPLAVLALVVAELGIASTALFGGVHLAAGDSTGPIGAPPDPASDGSSPWSPRRGCGSSGRTTATSAGRRSSASRASSAPACICAEPACRAASASMALPRRNGLLRNYGDACAEASLRRLRRRPRLPLRLHPGLVAAVEGAQRRGRRADRRALPRTADRDALVGIRAEPGLRARVRPTPARAAPSRA